MGNCSSTTKPPKNEMPAAAIKQIQVEPFQQKSSDDSHSTLNGRTEPMCSTPEPEIEEIVLVDEVRSAPEPQPEQIQPRPKSPLQIDVNAPVTLTPKSQALAPPEVKSRAKPLTDAESLEQINRLFNGPPTPQQLVAIQRIQRLARNKSAWRLAEAERDWKVASSSLPFPPPLPLTLL
jgi:hypothetical protein